MRNTRVCVCVARTLREGIKYPKSVKLYNSNYKIKKYKNVENSLKLIASNYTCTI